MIFHISALDALGRYPEALEESKKVTTLDPTNPVAQKWLGISLARLGQDKQAILALETSLKLNSSDATVSTWLAYSYLKTGNQTQAIPVLETLIQGHPKEEQLENMGLLGRAFYETGDSKSAITWWKQAASLGDKSAAQYLSWAYSTGYGVPQDQGDSAYWSRISDDPFPWFPRLSTADAFIKNTDGWGLVLIMLLSAAFLPLPTLGIVAYCISRRVTRDPAVHWTERARRSYPFQIFLVLCSLLLPTLYAAGSDYYPGSMLPVPKWLLFWTVFFVGLISTNWVIVCWSRRYRDNPDSFLQGLQNLVVTLFLYAPVFIIFINMAVNLRTEWNWQAGLIIIAAILAYFWLQFGGWVRLGRILHLLIPADDEISNTAALLANRRGRPKPAVWIFRWRRFTALAFPFSNTIVVTQGLRALLSREEITSVLAHELAHLCEDNATRLIRLLTPLLLLPLFTLGFWWPSCGWTGLIVCYAVVLVGFVILRKRARRMEERADTFGKEAERETGTYSLALAKLYEANQVPAVMVGKRKIHPHLYDRLLAAGITPDYPRPKAPSRWGMLAVLFTIALNVISLTALWLLLF